MQTLLVQGRNLYLAGLLLALQGLFTFRQPIAGLQETDFYLGRIKFLHVEKPYRLITSLPYLSKVFERCVADKVISFFNTFSLLRKLQFGFQNKKSTCDALLNLTEVIYNNLNNNKVVLNIL